jgi:lycopene cyclase domain-containing protein
MDHFQYLGLMAGCVLVTLPIEVILKARVWRSPKRLAKAVLPTAAVFALWDLVAIAAGEWSFSRRYTTGVDLPGHLPIEEVVFFLVIPVAAILTWEGVGIVLEGSRHRRQRRLRAFRRPGRAEEQGSHRA